MLRVCRWVQQDDVLESVALYCHKLHTLITYGPLASNTEKLNAVLDKCPALRTLRVDAWSGFQAQASRPDVMITHQPDMQMAQWAPEWEVKQG